VGLYDESASPQPTFQQRLHGKCGEAWQITPREFFNVCGSIMLGNWISLSKGFFDTKVNRFLDVPEEQSGSVTHWIASK